MKRLLLAFFSAAILWSVNVVAVADESEPQRFSLWDGRAPINNDNQFEEGDAWITVHRPASPNGTAVVICPGGGYGGLVTGGEGHGIAKWLNGHGITGVVLEYRLPNGRSFVPLLDAQRAIRTVRANAKQWKLDPARVGIIGFSAGGHLASTAATHFDLGNADATNPIDRLSCRPDFAILVYPVITMGETTHGGSRTRLLGESPSDELVTLFSNEKQVTANTPPTFLAHAVDDKPVPIENSRLFHKACQAFKVPSRLLELPAGGHGLNGYQGPMWDAWQSQSIAWIKQLKPQAAAKPKRADPLREIAAKLEPTRKIAYKKVGERELQLHVFEPDGLSQDDRRPCFVTIHGGGWAGGEPRRMYPLADHYAKLGLVGISVEYRLLRQDPMNTVFDCVKDGRSAIRYIRSHAQEFGIDTDKIIVNGASAGGHVAVSTALFDDVNDAADNIEVSCSPNAMVLFYPVIDTSKDGYGNAKIGERWQELSPVHNVRADLPPTLLFHGTGDTVTPFVGAKGFCDAMQKAGNRCELDSNEGGQHGYLMFDLDLYADTLDKTDRFLKSLGLLP